MGPTGPPKVIQIADFHIATNCDKLQQEYQLVWPFEAGSVAEELDLGFELDRDAGIWRTIGDIEDPSTNEILEVLARGAIQGQTSEEDLSISLDRLALNEEEYAWFVCHCVNGDIKQAALCLKGLDPIETCLRKKNSDGNTALALACMEGHYDMVVYLVEQGSLIDSMNDRGEAPLIISLEYGRIEVATYLIRHGASISSRDGCGVSVLAHANKCHGNPRLPDKHGYTAGSSISQRYRALTTSQ
ncbi:hypothetical protein PSPO01_14725 [Paraphaeosphaeria sporulosa]